MIKLTFCLVRLPHLTLDAFQTYWRETHAPLVRDRAGILKIRRYVQSHTLDEAAYPWMRASRNAPPGYDGVAELWWDSMEDLTASSPEATRAAAELLEDERRFIDLARSPLFLSQAYEVVG